ncbi:hypothetical protein NQ317_005939, partial [Molorchus minor]
MSEWAQLGRIYDFPSLSTPYVQPHSCLVGVKVEGANGDHVVTAAPSQTRAPPRGSPSAARLLKAFHAPFYWGRWRQDILSVISAHVENHGGCQRTLENVIQGSYIYRKRVKVVVKIVELVVAVVETLEHIYSKVIVIKQKWHVYARPHHMLQTEEEVLGIVEDDPLTSTREIARQ